MTFKLILRNLRGFITGSPAAFAVVVLLEIFGAAAVVLSYGIVRNVFTEQEQETYMSRQYIIYMSEDRQGYFEDSAAFMQGMQRMTREFGSELDDAFCSGRLFDGDVRYSVSMNWFPDEERFSKLLDAPGVDYSRYSSGERLVHVSSGRFKVSAGDTVTVCGRDYKAYKVSPGDNMWCDIGFFFPSAPDGIQVQALYLDFADIPLRSRIEELNDLVRELFGSDLLIVEPDIPDLLIQQFNLTSLGICAAIALIVVFNCITVYMYIFEKRRSWLAVVKLCGCKDRRCSAIFLGEAMLVTAVCTAAGTLIAALAVIPGLESSFKAFPQVYSVGSYLIIAAAYCLLSLVILTISVTGFVGETVDAMRKEAAR
ncbi:MAG: hypothetical protein IKN17_13550 [Ruminococcus sp.]|nr:hypothetical protein [Ruminococcus sp.]